MTQNHSEHANAYRLTAMAMMAALIYVVTLFRFPMLGSMVHFANALCLLSGMLLGPLAGGISAGLGSALFDAFGGGYGPIEVAITFVSKFAMAWVCGRLLQNRRKDLLHTVIAAVAGALTYVLLYMLKTFIFQRFVYGFAPDAVWATMISKLIPSLINAGLAIVAAPVFFHALRPALRGAHLEHVLAGSQAPDDEGEQKHPV